MFKNPNETWLRMKLGCADERTCLTVRGDTWPAVFSRAFAHGLQQEYIYLFWITLTGLRLGYFIKTSERGKLHWPAVWLKT